MSAAAALLPAASLRAVANALQSVGLPVVFCEPVSESFLPGVRIHHGTLEIAPDARINDVLHEAGHLAVTPTRFRSYLHDNIEAGMERAFDACSADEDPDARALLHADEQAATAWSYAFGRSLGLDARTIIADSDFDGTGSSQRLAQRIGRHPGIQSLRGGGMCAYNYHRDQPQWPQLLRWLQGPNLDHARNNDMSDKSPPFLGDQTPAELAAMLRRAGFSVTTVQNGDDVEDGDITITARVRIQVPTFGGAPGVVRETAEETFIFSPERRDFDALCTDLREALSHEPRDSAAVDSTSEAGPGL